MKYHGSICSLVN